MKKLLEFERVQRIIAELRKHIIKKRQPVEGLLFVSGQETKAFHSSDYFGSKNQYYTIVGELNLPEEFRGETIDLAIFSSLTEWDNSTNPQIKVYFDDELIQGLDVNHTTLRLTQEQATREQIPIRIEIFSGREEKRYPLTVELRWIDQPSYQLFYDFFVALDSWRSLNESDPNYFYYEKELGKAVNKLNFFQPYGVEYYQGLKQAHDCLQQAFYQNMVDKKIPQAFVVGHTHIDLAWLWTVMQAVEKGERSFSTNVSTNQRYIS